MTLAFSRSPFVGLAAAATLFQAGAARADVPPPPGYVERCTVEQQQSAQAIPTRAA